MKKIICLLLFLLLIKNMQAQVTERFHHFQGVSIKGDTIHFSQYAGKRLLVVNTASYCAYTPQYKDLATLDSIYGGANFAIIGFPCNDFGSQEPGDDSVINQFCTGTYNVKFQMMSKVSIISADTAEVYKWLQLQSRNGVADAPVTWNFHKYLIDRNGRWVQHFPSTTSPLDTAITNWITSADPVSVTEINKARLHIYPNPATEKAVLTLQVEKPQQMEVNLLSMQGQKVKQIFSGVAANAATFTISLADLPPGIYFVRVTTESGAENLKLSVIR